MDPTKLTQKSQEALEAARHQAVARNHQTIEPEHLLFALLSDPEGIVIPVLDRAGVAAGTVRDRVDEALDRIPKVFTQGAGAVNAGAALSRLLATAAAEAEKLG